jgi:hypothetical protein
MLERLIYRSQCGFRQGCFYAHLPSTIRQASNRPTAKSGRYPK